MKKIKVLLGMLLLVAFVPLVLVACSEKECRHDYEVVSEVAATCTETGTKDLVCKKCGETKTETIDILGHDLVDDPLVPADCTNPGKEAGKHCSRCDYTEGGATIAALGHVEVVIPAKAATCMEAGHTEGKACSRCNKAIIECTSIPIDPNAHKAAENIDGDWFKSVCLNGCGEFVLEPTTRFVDSLVYTYNLEGGYRYQDIEDAYNVVDSHLDTLDDYDPSIHSYVKHSALYEEYVEFLELYNDFLSFQSYIVTQADIAESQFYITYGTDAYETWYARNNEIIVLRNTYDNWRFSIYPRVYDSMYREYFFHGWSEEEIEECLSISGVRSDEEYARLNSRKEEIEVEARGMSSRDMKYGTKVPELYHEYVSLANQLARMRKDDDDNPLYNTAHEYAYSETYHRDYTPEDALVARSYIKQIVDAYLSLDSLISQKKAAYPGKYVNPLDANFRTDYEAFAQIGDFFASIVDDTTKTPINFKTSANHMFDTGAFLYGQNEIGYTTMTLGTPYIYLGDMYIDILTFVHEFGHYFNFVYNGDLNLQYDHYETHSQGLELLYLAYMKDYVDEKTYEILQLEQLEAAIFDMLICAMVDDFEYRVYYKDSIGEPYQTTQYDGLFISIIAEYGLTNIVSPAYWRYVTIDSASYYISYSMGLVSTIEIYIDAMENGFDSAVEEYLKLITFTDDPNNMDGNETILSFDEILAYAGLSSHFAPEIYEKIYHFITGSTIDIVV